MRISKLVFLFLLPYSICSQTLSYALEQIEGDALISAGLNGTGIKIGIIDGGFLGANHTRSLAAHFNENRIAYYKDFVSPEMSPYGGSIRLNDDHGTEVWELIGGNNTKTGIQHGLATESIYYLARTDHDVRENRNEERDLIQAMHEMIALGVKVFNISLGYTDGFDSTDQNYTTEQIDGKSTWITRSLDSVLNIHDVLVVISAGNDGDTRWRILSAPADSKNVITVGATKFSLWENMKYSSIGPSKLDYVKPDLSCYASNGTSYSAPIITGLAACIMQYDSTLSTAQIKNLLIQSSHLYPFPNNLTGYGVPSGRKILELLKGLSIETITSFESNRNSITLNTSSSVETGQKARATIYHKNGWKIIRTEHRRFSKKLRIRRPIKGTQSTVLVADKGYEINWK